MSGRHATEQGFFESRRRLICGCINRCAGHSDTYSAMPRPANFDIRMDKAMNPKSLPIHIMSALISADRCPNCLGELDTGYECNSCGFDAAPWLKASTAINDATFDRREA